jgi:hypothetical protein
VDIGTSQMASLDALAFEGATKRSKPNLKVGLGIRGERDTRERAGTWAAPHPPESCGEPALPFRRAVCALLIGAFSAAYITSIYHCIDVLHSPVPTCHLLV